MNRKKMYIVPHLMHYGDVNHLTQKQIGIQDGLICLDDVPTMSSETHG